MVNSSGGLCYVSPCSFAERGGVEGTGTVAEAASQRRADAPWAVDLVQRQGMRVQEISDTLHLHEEYVRQLIRQFTTKGD